MSRSREGTGSLGQPARSAPSRASSSWCEAVACRLAAQRLRTPRSHATASSRVQAPFAPRCVPR